MAIQSMPATPRMQSTRFLLQGNSRELTSPLTKSVQTMEYVGSRWMGTYGLPPMKRAAAEEWLSFLTRLNGRYGRFYAGDAASPTPRGVATGTPTVNGASQVGTSLVTAGWTGTITGILLTGDYIAWNTPTSWRELHKVVVDANSDGGGAATLTITPPIRESPANGASIITASATCVMMLATDEFIWDVDEALRYGINFDAVEVFRDSY